MRRSPSESYRAAARISARRALQYSRYSRLMIADMTELRRLHPVLDASDGALPGDVVTSRIRFRRRGILASSANRRRNRFTRSRAGRG